MGGSVFWAALVVLATACTSDLGTEPDEKPQDTVVTAAETTEAGHLDEEVEDDAAAAIPSCDAEATSQVAVDIVDNLLVRLVEGGASGDFEPAAELWTGFYADDNAAKFLRGLVESNGWLLDGELVLTAVDSYTDPRFCPGKVVAVTDLELRGAFAVLVDPTGTIQRIQHPDDAQGAPEFTSSGVVLPTAPVEGSLVAYIWLNQLPDGAMTVSPDGRTTIRFPTSNVEPELLIVSMATPELPTAYAVLVP
ncbi:MAG: hypothetical protein AAGA65_27370 [Actinomycetota bacterium]